MPAKQFLISSTVQKHTRKLPLFVHKKIGKAYRKIKENPLAGERLRGELGNYYKFRIGDYRIVYRFDAESSTITIVKIEHRQGVYK